MTGAVLLRERLGRLRHRLSGSGVIAALARGSLASLVTSGLAAVTVVLVQFCLSRLMGVAQFGAYAYALAWLNFLAMVAALGFDTSALRFVAAYRARSEWSLLRGFTRSSARLPLLIGVLLASAGLAAARLTGIPVEWPLVLVTAAVLPLAGVMRVLTGQLQGLRRIVAGQGLSAVVRPALIGLGAAGLAIFSSRRVDASQVMGANLTATFVVVVAAAMALRRYLPPEVRAAAPAYQGVHWARTALALFLISASQTLLATTDVLMLGSMRGTTVAGIYSVASQLSTAITFAITAVNGILAPLIAELHASGRHTELQRVVTLAARGVVLFALPVTIGLIALGGTILGLYGPEFLAGWVALAILCVGQFMIAACGSVGFLMTMTGHERVASLVIVCSAVVNIILNAVLIPRAGMVGAALATAAAVSLRSLTLTVFVRRYVGIQASAFASLRGRQ